jgi:hypothetical protein
MKNTHVKKGTRVIFESTTDPWTGLRPGTSGTVVLVDDTGTVHVKWDTGENLGMIPGEDRYRVIT